MMFAAGSNGKQSGDFSKPKASIRFYIFNKNGAPYYWDAAIIYAGEKSTALGDIKTISIHHLGPGCHEISHKFIM